MTIVATSELVGLKSSLSSVTVRWAMSESHEWKPT